MNSTGVRVGTAFLFIPDFMRGAAIGGLQRKSVPYVYPTYRNALAYLFTNT